MYQQLEGAITPATALQLAHKYSPLGFVEEVELFQKSVSFTNYEDFHVTDPLY